MQDYEAELVEALTQVRAYPHDRSAERGVEHVQTHLSHVFLTPERVYKLRKAVSFGFVDFGSTHARNTDCRNEVDLNRRLAPDVYLGIAPIQRVAGLFELGAVSAVADFDADLEHVVVMRRLAQGRDALSLLEGGEFRAEMLDLVAERLAGFHAEHGLGRPAPFSASEWKKHIVEPVSDNFDALAANSSEELLDEIESCRQLTRSFESVHWERLEQRRVEGRVVDGHGDLHLQHLWFEREDRPIVIDCLEFSSELRRIDAAADVAFLLMDLRYRGRPGLAHRFARKYAAQSDDFGLYGVIDYFISYRAAVRAKVASLAGADPRLPAEQRAGAHASVSAHVALAKSALESRPKGSVVALCGTIGTGKSAVAEELAESLPGVPIASDHVRKHEAGLKASDRASAAWNKGLYTPEARERVYEGLLERAKPVVDSGRTAILDASFARRATRSTLQTWGRKEGVEVILVEIVCPEDVVRERLERRASSGSGASDAGPELLERSLNHHETPDEWPRQRHVRIDTNDPEWREELHSLARS
ncbi:MAG: AAA family ATPase, partial [bacterium]|nr:AAA family ATPase [bacterium]